MRRRDFNVHETAARIGLLMFAIGALAEIRGWLPILLMAGTDAAIVTALLGMIALLLGATIWFLCVP